MHSRVCIRLGLDGVCADTVWVYRQSAFTVAFIFMACYLYFKWKEVLEE